MTPSEWGNVVSVLRATYQASFKLDAAGVGIWYKLLADLPGHAVEAAVIHLCQTVQAFPSIAEIRRLATPAEAGPEDAWLVVMAACRDYGRYGRFIPGTHEVIDGVPRIIEPGRTEHASFPVGISRALLSIGGYASVLEAGDKERSIMRAQFLKAMAALSSTDKHPVKAIAAEPLRALPAGALEIGRTM